jgi:hypothetical protein
MTQLELLEAVTVFTPPSPAANITPCLVGPTGAGKTSRVLRLAEARKLPVVRLLLGTMLPEDVLGLPRVIRGATRWAKPDWAEQACRQPVLLFLDELDKARTETYGAVLTLLAERLVRDQPLHPETVVIAAMQPVDPDAWLSDETGRALSARLLFVPVAYDWDWLGDKLGVNLAGLPTPAVNVPVLPEPSPRQVEWWASFARQHPNLAEPAGFGLFPEPIVKWLLERLASAPSLKATDVVSAICADPALLGTLSVPECIELAPDLMERGSPAVWEELLVRVWTAGGPDEASAFLRRTYEELAKRAQERGGELEVGGDTPAEDYAAAIERATARIADAWMRRPES